MAAWRHPERRPAGLGRRPARRTCFRGIAERGLEVELERCLSTRPGDREIRRARPGPPGPGHKAQPTSALTNQPTLTAIGAERPPIAGSASASGLGEQRKSHGRKRHFGLRTVVLIANEDLPPGAGPLRKHQHDVALIVPDKE